jgi:hypothetical protein
MTELTLWMQRSLLDGDAEVPNHCLDWPVVDAQLHRYFIDVAQLVDQVPALCPPHCPR